MSLLLELRRSGAQAHRWIRDRITGAHRRFPGPEAVPHGFPIRITVEQPIHPSTHVEAKRHNLALARTAIERIVLRPGEIFSFWRLVGRPTAERGFMAGRSLLGGRLVADLGGGLCQLSGILYHLALLGGLDILERHSHSLDLYRNQNRSTPLGADAAVAYGFKDLRFANPHAAPMGFALDLEPGCLRAHLCAPDRLEPSELEFRMIEEGVYQSIVETWRRLPHQSGSEWLGKSNYRYPEGEATSELERARAGSNLKKPPR